MSPAPGKDPPDLVVIFRIVIVQPFYPFAVRKGAFIDEGRNHTELAFFSPGNESVLFVTHKTQQYLKELHRIPGPARVQYPLSTALRAFARLVVFGNPDAKIRKTSGSARGWCGLSFGSEGGADVPDGYFRPQGQWQRHLTGGDLN